MSDGSVYIEAEGPEDKLFKLLNFCKVGPKYAEVEKVDFEFEEPQDRFKGFEYAF